MVFYPPPCVPKLPFGEFAESICRESSWGTDGLVDPPDSITVGEFMRNEIYGRRPLARSRNPFTCGITGKTRSAAESHERSDLIAQALARVMGWEPNADLPWNKVICVFSLNTVSRRSS